MTKHDRYGTFCETVQHETYIYFVQNIFYRYWSWYLLNHTIHKYVLKKIIQKREREKEREFSPHLFSTLTVILCALTMKK